MKESFYNIDYNEQETNINIDYSNSIVTIYSSRKTQIQKIKSRIGEPTEVYYTDKKISGSKWVVPFCQKKVLSSILSRPLLIGNIK